MNCTDTERLLELRSAELLSPEEDAALKGHLEACPACREQVDALNALFDDARLPPLTAADEQRIEELRRLRPLKPVARPKVLRWAVTGAAIAASALIGLHLGSVQPPARHVTPLTLPAGATASRSVNSARIQDVDFSDDGSDFGDTVADSETDSALYDAVVFQGGVMPFDADNR